ncbi:MAG: hypothetical protein HY332_10075 [Chloroflexi bacterium]|nr:hypothetical protein [Chloroflexota bacterium]
MPHDETASATGTASHYCPQCLKRVSATSARRCRHRELCRSGPLDVLLLQCPACGLVLAAEIEPPAPWQAPGEAA